MKPHSYIIVRRSELNEAAYNDCIDRSRVSKLYAYSWYLDAMAEHWEVFVWGDYQYVMPVAIRKKFGLLTYVYQPLMVQQLGVFPEMKNVAMGELLGRYRHVDYTFHGSHTSPRSQLKPNLVLSLQPSIQQHKSTYSTNRIRDLKKASSHELMIGESGDLSLLLHLLKSHLPAAYRPAQSSIQQLLSIKKSTGDIRWLQVFKEQECIFVLIYGVDNQRVYYLLPMTIDELAKKTGAATLAIDHLIKRYWSTHEMLDFEGSALPGVRHFYESFGALDEPYSHYYKTVLKSD